MTCASCFGRSGATPLGRTTFVCAVPLLIAIAAALPCGVSAQTPSTTVASAGAEPVALKHHAGASCNGTGAPASFVLLWSDGTIQLAEYTVNLIGPPPTFHLTVGEFTDL